MNQPSSGLRKYVLSGTAVVCLFIILGWFAVHKERSPLDQRPIQVEQVKPQAHPIEPILIPADDVVAETPTNQPNDSAVTNAATLYRQAFDLFNALTKDQQLITHDWQTNVDASVEAELCEKLHPICDLMHQASAVTNCDWGINPMTFETKLTHLVASRAIARAAIWNAAHCRSNDVTGAVNDTVAVIRLGEQISQSALIGYLVDIAVQGMVLSYVAQNLDLFSGADGQRLVATITNPSDQGAPTRAMEQEADMLERYAERLASLPPKELQKELSGLHDLTATPLNLDPSTAIDQLRQVVDSDRQLAKALASSSDDDYEIWLKHATELEAASPLANILMANDRFVNKARLAEVNRAMVTAGLAVAEGGTEALAAHPDPASGKPFQYTQTDDGFELQSTFVVNEKPYKIRFK